MYPRLTRRIQALLIDSLILSLIFILSVALVSYLNLESELANVAIAFLPTILVEPLLVSIRGGTIGHYFLGLRVRRTSSDHKLNIFVAIFRTIVKAIFGTISLVSVLTTKKHQAIHDLISNSLVVLNDANSLPCYDVQSERVLDYDTYNYPSALRRLLFIFIYFILFFVSIGFMFFFLLSNSCIEYSDCSSIDSIVYVCISIYFWIGVFIIPALGWLSRLYGSRKVRRIKES